MLTKHITPHLEAYLDNRLTPEECRHVEAHLAQCPACARRLAATRRVAVELGPVFKTALGQPIPPPELRRRVRLALAETDRSRRIMLPWAAWGRAFNAIGTLAVIVLLAVGLVAVVRGQLPGALPEIQTLRPNPGGGEMTTPAPTPTLLSTPPALAVTPPSPGPALSALGDTLPTPTPHAAMNETIVVSPTAAVITPTPSPQPAAPELPGGVIAFSVFNPATGRQVYEIHFIDPASGQARLFALNGVSEPAMSPDGLRLAYRAWSEPTSPRSLLSSNLAGDTPARVGGFWEDAQPDWSPTENRLIFASQREVDRRWRLYTSWGDGSNEVNLRREGKSPTFAPDGYRFAFVSCDTPANTRCGLWLGDLEHSEYESRPFLEDPLAQAPDWSPVGEQIAYMANPGGNWDLYRVNSDGTEMRRLTTDPAIDGLPAWSPDGKWLAFLSNRGGSWGLWLLYVDTGQARRLVSLEGYTFTPPNRSPYGQRDWGDEQVSWGK